MNRERLPADIVLAANRIAPHIRETPLDHSPWFSERTGASVYMKLENLQYTCSFKLRGAFNKLLSLTPDERRAGCVAASSGNHGAAIAWAMKKLGVTGVVFVPEQTSSAKVDNIRRAGAEVQFFGTDGLDTETHARQYAQDKGMVYLSPYNDIDVIAGQGSCGVEIARQLDKEHLTPEVVGKAGEIVDIPSEPTLSDGTAGGIEAGAITFDLCRELVDEYVTVSEEEIVSAMQEFIDSHHMLLEGAAGVAIAGLLQRPARYEGKNVVVVVCGGNISRETLKKVI